MAVVVPLTTPTRERMFIGGEWIESADGRTFDVETPATRGKVVAHVPRSGAADVDRAVRAAAAAFPVWRAVAPRDRGRLLLRIADDVDAAVEDLARTLAMETGNAIRTQARPEAKLVADVFRYFGGLGGELKGETVPLGETMFSYTRREPYGVVAAIVPWNVPILIAAWKVAPALIAGNTVVLKPSANAPLAVLHLARICAAHLPKGVLNVITGTGEEVGTTLAKLKVGDPLDEKSDMGAIVSRQQFDKVVGYIDEGIHQQGARTVIGGPPPSEGPLATGYYVEPTVFANVRNDWRIAREEIFGPVLVAIPWRDEADAVRMANDTHYGLAAYIWSRNISKALRTAHAVDAGWVQVNQGIGQVVGQPYGGFKESGLGRENSLEGMLESFTQRKSVTINLAY